MMSKIVIISFLVFIASSCSSTGSNSTDTKDTQGVDTIDSRDDDTKDAQKWDTEDGLTEDGLTEDGLTEDGLTEDGLTEDGQANDLSALFPNQCQTVPCEEPQTMTSLTEFVNFVSTLPWSWIGAYSGECLPISKDIAISGSIVVSSNDIQPSEGCLSRDDCRHKVNFLIGVTTGVVCNELETDTIYSGWGECQKMTLTDTTVRIRLVHHDTHPWIYNFVPHLEVLASCSEPCKEGEWRCEANDTCWASFERYCAFCLAGDKQVCPCYNMKDQTECFFAVSGDVLCQGVCEKDVCQYTGEPGWAGCP